MRITEEQQNTLVLENEQYMLQYKQYLQRQDYEDTEERMIFMEESMREAMNCYCEDVEKETIPFSLEIWNAYRTGFAAGMKHQIERIADSTGVGDEVRDITGR